MRSYLFLICSILCISSPTIYAQGGRIPVTSEHGMVVTSHYLASQSGDDILKKGGNAIDAAVATAFSLAVVLPSAGNIGGGGFLLYYTAEGKKTTFNFREKAPLAATEKMYLDEDGKVKDNSNHDGILAVGVPGTVAGLYKAHQKYGKLPWKTLISPAISLAENGFPVAKNMQWFMEWLQENKEQYATTAAIFLKNGVPFKNGDTLVQKDLAQTLKRIQLQGADGFYKGKTASLISQYMQKNKGIITKEDLEKYTAEELPPITGKYRGYDIVGMPPPSSGGVAVVEMLNILEAYNLQEKGQNSAISLHLITEAMRRAFADRALYLGDANFNPNMPISKITSKEYAAQLRKTIQKNKASQSDSANFNKYHLKPESSETTHISIVDKQGNAVSMTYTLEHSYGSKMLVEGAGFLLNNEMGDFNAIPGFTDTKGNIGTFPNRIAPQKRMLSSMSPTIIAKNGKPLIVIGSPGGRTIINTVLQVVVNMLDYNLNIAKAIESPRIHHQWLPDITYFEDWGFSPDTKKIYENMGHKIEYGGSQGRAMGIYIDPEDHKYYGAADSRSYKGGAVGH